MKKFIKKPLKNNTLKSEKSINNKKKSKSHKKYLNVRMFLLNNNMPTHNFGMSPDSDMYHADPYYSTNTTCYTPLYPVESHSLVNGKRSFWVLLSKKHMTNI